MNPLSIRELSLDRIICPPQVRGHFDEESLAGLARSMAAVGLLQPVLVEPAGENFKMVDGERRVRCARFLKWDSIPALVQEHESSETETIQLQLIANCQREGLSPIEEAIAIDRLMNEANLTAVEVASKTGFSEATIAKRRPLLLLSQEAQDAIHQGNLASSTGYEIATVRDPRERAKLTADAMHGRLTRDSVLARKGTRRKPPPRSKKRDEIKCIVARVGPDCTVSFAGSVLSFSHVVDAIETLASRIHGVERSGVDLAEAQKLLSGDAA